MSQPKADQRRAQFQAIITDFIDDAEGHMESPDDWLDLLDLAKRELHSAHELRLMLIRDGSLLDADGMKLLADMAESAGAQVLIERVQTGSEVGVEIADGEVVEHTEETTAAPELAAV